MFCSDFKQFITMFPTYDHIRRQRETGKCCRPTAVWTSTCDVAMSRQSKVQGRVADQPLSRRPRVTSLHQDRSISLSWAIVQTATEIVLNTVGTHNCPVLPENDESIARGWYSGTPSICRFAPDSGNVVWVSASHNDMPDSAMSWGRGWRHMAPYLPVPPPFPPPPPPPAHPPHQPWRIPMRQVSIYLVTNG